MKRRLRRPLDPQRSDLRLLLLMIAAISTPLTILCVADVLDGVTYQGWGRRITLGENPNEFAIALLLPLAGVCITGLAWLGIVSDFKPQWMPAGLRGKPVPLLACLSAATLVAVLFGVELSDGHVELRRLGHVSAETPTRLGFVWGAYFVGLILLALSWLIVWRAWTEKLPYRWKPPLDDADKRRPL